MGLNDRKGSVSDQGFEIQLAKGHKDSNVGVAWAVEQSKDPVIEPKYDGWRGIVKVEADGRVRVFSGRNGKEYTGQAPELEAELAKLPAGTILDGEIVILGMVDGRYVNEFKLIQTAMASKLDGPKAHLQKCARLKLQYIAFDALTVGGVDVAALPQQARRDRLEAVVAASQLDSALVSVTAQFDATQDMHDTLVGLGFEGTIVKDRTKPYAFGARGHGWFKFKGTDTMELVILELPVNGKGQHTDKVGHIVAGQIRGPEGLVKRCTVNPKDNAMRAAMTARPWDFIGKVIEIKIYGVDECGGPRHPTFLRFRDDKNPEQCEWSHTDD